MATLFLIIIYSAFISLGLPDSLLGVAWPAMQPEYNVPFGFAGLISMVISGGTIISSFLSGKLLKRFGTGKLTFFSVLMTAAALLGFSFAPSFIWLIAASVPLGLGAGAVDSGLNVYIADHYQSHHMSWLHCFWGVGAMLGPIIMSNFIRQNLSWKNGYLTVSIIQFALVTVLFFSLPLWNKIASLKKADFPETEEPLENQETGHKSFLYPLKISGFKIVLVSFLFYCGVEATVGLWGGSYLVKARGLDVPTAAQWISMFYGSITVGRFISGFITMRVSNKVLIRIGELVIFAGAVILFLPLPDIFSLFAFVLIGLGCAPIYPCMLHETPARFGKENSQTVMGFQMAVAYIGSTFLPPLFGFLVSDSAMAVFPIFIFVYAITMLLSSERINSFMKRKNADTVL